MNGLKALIGRAFELTPYEIRRRLPRPNIEAIRLVLAYYKAARVPVVVLQIGACDGISSDPLHEFLKQSVCRAAVVEPVPSSFEKLRAAYLGNPHVIPIQAAIGNRDGVIKMFKVREGAISIDSFWGPQLASFERAHLRKHKVRDEDIEEVQVRCLTLQSLAAELNLEAIDILQVDTEGFDAEVVSMALRMPSLPKCINFEHIHLNAKTRSRLYKELKARGYIWTHDKWNTLALLDTPGDRWW